MTLADLSFDIEKACKSKASIQETVDLLADNLEVLPELIDCAFSGVKNYHKYCWLLDYLNRRYIEILCPHMDVVLVKVQFLSNQSAIRPIARVIESFVLNYYSKKPNDIVVDMMTSEVKEKMAECCFEWLIDKQLKVASRAYSMSSLFHLGKDINWIHEELYLILEQNYATESLAYQARARMVLKKLSK